MVHRCWRFALLALCLVCGLGATSAITNTAAAVDYVTISGSLSNPLGPIYFGSIALQDGAKSYTGTIGANGSFSIIAPEGTYTAVASGRFSAPGQPWKGSFQLTHRGAAVDASAPLLLSLPARPLTVNVSDGTGRPIAASVAVTCQPTVGNETVVFDALRSGTDSVQTWGIPGDSATADPSCSVRAWKGNTEGVTTSVVMASTGDNATSITVPVTYSISGAVTPADPAAEPYNFFEVNGANVIGTSSNSAVLGNYAYELSPGTYSFFFQFLKNVDGHDDDSGVRYSEERWTTGVQVSTDTVHDLAFQGRTLTVHLVDRQGAPTASRFSLTCLRPRGFQVIGDDGVTPTGEATDMMSSSLDQAMDTATLRVPAPDGITDPWSCEFKSPQADPPWSGRPITLPAGSDMTIVMPGDVTYGGEPTDGPGDDGVSSLTEALGPNHGDGNGDGVSDSEQANVTSLPSNGAAYSDGAPYLTLAGPAGSTLKDVSTTDPKDLPAPPATLPAGLASFKLTGLADGATAKVSIYPGDMTGVNGYAKWDGSSWSLLHSDRVHPFADHLDIDLTDGGEGDADGLANGVIVDPGGVARVVPSDSSAPTVSGTPTTQPNANGWYRSPVKVHWTAEDPSGVAALPADTTVSTEGADVTAESALVCDKVSPNPNCTTGKVTGLKIDRTAPSLSVTGVSNGASYTLGNVPAVGCSAGDAVSGLAAACRGAKAGGNSAGVGSFGYAATVSDKAGNTRAAAAAWNVVYGFSGFAAPLNDPAVTPGAPTSVFKAGSTVPVAFSLKKANGTVATPSSRPVWVSPIKGSKSTASINEAVTNGPGTSGNQFVWRNNRWEFNWSTKGLASGYLYKIGVKLDDGTTKTLTIGLR